LPVDKISSLIGFAVRSGKITLGYDRIIESKQRKYLIIFVDEINVTAKKRLIKYAQENKIALLCTKIDLAQICGFNKCKAIAIIDKQMSQAALQNINDNFQLLFSEEK